MYSCFRIVQVRLGGPMGCFEAEGNLLLQPMPTSNRIDPRCGRRHRTSHTHLPEDGIGCDSGAMGMPEDRYRSASGAPVGAVGSVQGAHAAALRSACDMLVCICACYDVGVLKLCGCYSVGMMAGCETCAMR